MVQWYVYVSMLNCKLHKTDLNVWTFYSAANWHEISLETKAPSSVSLQGLGLTRMSIILLSNPQELKGQKYLIGVKSLLSKMPPKTNFKQKPL